MESIHRTSLKSLPQPTSSRVLPRQRCRADIILHSNYGVYAVSGLVPSIINRRTTDRNVSRKRQQQRRRTTRAAPIVYSSSTHWCVPKQTVLEKNNQAAGMILSATNPVLNFTHTHKHTHAHAHAYVQTHPEMEKRPSSQSSHLLRRLSDVVYRPPPSQVGFRHVLARVATTLFRPEAAAAVVFRHLQTTFNLAGLGKKKKKKRIRQAVKTGGFTLSGLGQRRHKMSILQPQSQSSRPSPICCVAFPLLPCELGRPVKVLSHALDDHAKLCLVVTRDTAAAAVSTLIGANWNSWIAIPRDGRSPLP